MKKIFQILYIVAFLGLTLQVHAREFGAIKAGTPGGLSVGFDKTGTLLLKWKNNDIATNYSVELVSVDLKGEYNAYNLATSSNIVVIPIYMRGLGFKYRVSITNINKDDRWSEWFHYNFIEKKEKHWNDNESLESIELAVSKITSNTAFLEWTENDMVNDYSVEVVSAEKNHKSRYAFNISCISNYFELDNFVPSTKYKFRVKINSAVNQDSNWTSWHYFTTNDLYNNPVDSKVDNFIIYPVPAKDHIIISKNAIDRHATLIKIFDSNGSLKLIQKLYVGEKDKQINLPGLGNGLYLLKIFNDQSELIYSTKFMKE